MLRSILRLTRDIAPSTPKKHDGYWGVADARLADVAATQGSLGTRMRALRLKSFAKINLGLEVLGLRDDGYHELRTLFQTIDLHDDLVLRPRGRGVTVRCDHPQVPTDATNLAARAAGDLLRYARVSSGVEIEITKRIPVGGGLGGGSSNAAAVLLGLDRLFKLGLGPDGLHRLACRLGADVPYFLLGGTALGVSRGDEVYALSSQLRAHVVVVDPEIPVSTARVFERVDRGLTPRLKSNSIFYFVSRQLEGAGAFRFLSNDLEEAALLEAPALREQGRRIRAVLERERAHMVALSGSGSSYFGLFDGRRRAERARAALAAEGLRATAARTLTLDRYRAAFGRAADQRGSRLWASEERAPWRSPTSRSSRSTTRS
jgi:4-diphosphocytidyl-2-C-methyl-D-erythritol kinase